jgi:hypothetical protein
VEGLPSQTDLWKQRYDLEAKLEHINNQEKIYWKQRGNVRWILEGDSNTNFFHQCANGRRWKNTIVALETDQGEIKSEKEIMDHVTAYYKSLFGSQPCSGMSLKDNFWEGRHTLTTEQGVSLTFLFQEEEVKKAVFGMRSDASPGPNGFGVHFFKTFWPIIKGDYMAMMGDFHKGDLDIRRLNYDVITLVPKLKEANHIKQYRPVCLLNIDYDYKGITKVLTNRLTPLAKEVIGVNQTGFIKGRNILEGVLILHEVVDELKRSKGKGLIMKIDFEKAYDKVRWDFLEQVMKGKGFPLVWTNWVMQTVRGGKVCVNANGERGGYFRTHQGLRQGDPLSPLLFNLVADVLSCLLDKAVQKQHIKGILPGLIPGGSHTSNMLMTQSL